MDRTTIKNNRLRIVEKAMLAAAGDRFVDISFALERVSPYVAEHMTTKELQMYIEAVRGAVM